MVFTAGETDLIGNDFLLNNDGRYREVCRRVFLVYYIPHPVELRNREIHNDTNWEDFAVRKAEKYARECRATNFARDGVAFHGNFC